jgi:alkylated DNA repair dioxygenase AlkB
MNTPMILPGLEGYADRTACPYFPEFFPKAEADALFQGLSATLPWGHAPEYFIAGECRKLSHETVWFGVDIHSAPTKCDVQHPVGWTPEILAIKVAVEAKVGSPFNSVLVNLYKNERSAIGAHNDKPSEGSWDYPIASVSLGAERRFRIREKSTTKILDTIRLEHGSLLVMPAGFQAKHLHEILKELERKRQPMAASTRVCIRDMLTMWICR